jgi:hypothetical protein
MPSVKYTFLDFAQDVLQVAPKPLTFQEIWTAGQDRGFVSKLAFWGKTPWQTLGARLFVDVRDNSHTPFMKVGKNPDRLRYEVVFARAEALGHDQVEKALKFVEGGA